MNAGSTKRTFWSVVADALPSRPATGTIVIVETAALVQQIRAHEGFDYVDAAIAIGLLLAPAEQGSAFPWIVTTAGENGLRFAAK